MTIYEAYILGMITTPLAFVIGWVVYNILIIAYNKLFSYDVTEEY